MVSGPSPAFLVRDCSAGPVLLLRLLGLPFAWSALRSPQVRPAARLVEIEPAFSSAGAPANSFSRASCSNGPAHLLLVIGQHLFRAGRADLFLRGHILQRPKYMLDALHGANRALRVELDGINRRTPTNSSAGARRPNR